MQIFPVFLPHAGCRQQCLFCDQHRTTGRSRLPDPLTVAAWLEQALPAQGQGEIAYYGGSFTSLPRVRQEEFLRVAGDCVEQGRVAGIRISTCPDTVTVERADQLAESGVKTVELGCQSFDDTVLSINRRGHSVNDIHRAVAACRSAGLSVGLQLMPGLAGATATEAIDSVREALTLKPAFLRIYPTLVFRQTGLAELWLRGDYRPLELDEAVDLVASQLLLCRDADVPVIRLGLQACEGLADAVLAGPWHPAFGQLVKSRLWRRALAFRAEDAGVVTVHPGDLGDALGHRRENLEWLQRRCALVAIKGETHLPRGFFQVGGRRHSLQQTLLQEIGNETA